MPLGIAKIGLINGISGAVYEGTDVSADLLWHMKMIPVSSFSTTYDVTTANGYESNGINVGGTTFASNVIVYDGIQTFGSGNITASGTVKAATLIGSHTSGSISGGVSGKSAGAKAFDIPHPSKEGYRLRHICVEGPESAVYYRGRTNKNIIPLPLYWKDLIDPASLTVTLTPIGAHQNIIVKRWDVENIYLQNQGAMPINCFFHVFAQRIDIKRLQVEYEGEVEDSPNNI